MELQNLVWAGLAVWLSGIWVAIGQWILAKSSVEVMWKKKDMISFFLTITILWIALVESAVIYWLIIAFQLIGKEWLTWIASIWVWCAIWFTGLWAWYWEWKLISGALKAMEENPKIKWKLMTFMILFVALIESAAIYGLVIAFKILWTEEASEAFLWMWLSIWLSGMWVAIGMWILADKTMTVMAKREDLSWVLLTITILWIALVESAAIYGLVVAFDLASKNLPFYVSTWAWLAIWLSWFWAWIWEWIAIRWAIYSLWRNPKIRAKLITFMVLFVALIEVVAIYWLIIAFKSTWDAKNLVDSIKNLAPWIAIWLAWVWVWTWIWLLTEEWLKTMWKNPKMINFLLTISILWVALVESSAIYALVVAFQILWWESIKQAAALWAGFAIWLAWLWVWIWHWFLIRWSIKWINTSPELRSKILAFMILFVALVEVVAIYGLIIAFQVIGTK